MEKERPQKGTKAQNSFLCFCASLWLFPYLSARPGLASVGWPSLTTRVPLTKICLRPAAGAIGLKTTISAGESLFSIPRSFLTKRGRGRHGTLLHRRRLVIAVFSR